MKTLIIGLPIKHPDLMRSMRTVSTCVGECDAAMLLHLSEHLKLINMPGVHFLMNTRAVISDNEPSDGWRPVRARDIHSHLHVERVVQQPRGSRGVHGNPSRMPLFFFFSFFFNLEDENA